MAKAIFQPQGVFSAGVIVRRQYGNRTAVGRVVQVVDGRAVVVRWKLTDAEAITGLGARHVQESTAGHFDTREQAGDLEPVRS